MSKKFPNKLPACNTHARLIREIENTPIKQVIVVRKDLNMRKGKMIAQGSHASVSVIIDDINCTNGQGFTLMVHEWLRSGQTKIVVGVDSEAELLQIYAKALGADISVSLIKDAGKTEFKEPTYTCVAIGPDVAANIDKITGHLKLL